MSTPCAHTRFEIISQDENGRFVECLDCREIFESSELDELQPKPERLSDHTEDLSDA